MSECIKRQREFNLGTEQHRCINPEAETFRELVVISQCEVCPVKRLLAKKPCCQGVASPPPCLGCQGQLPVLDEGFTPCQLRVTHGDGLMCMATGLAVNKEICGRCDEDLREHSASFGDKIVNYSTAFRKWIASGRPTRTDEEVAAIFEEHCSKCDRYDPEKQACKSCGCSINLGKSPLTNKVRMKTEHCPLGRF